jgi:predicted Zn finger-like uncharacterized protein
MLIVCPSCATSYMIDPASVGAAGRTVRCARCKATWFAGPAKNATDVSDFVDGVIAEAEAQSSGLLRVPAANASADNFAAQADNFGLGLRPGETPHTDIWAGTGLSDIAPSAAAPEPVAIDDAPSLVPPIGHAPLSGASSAALDAEDAENFAARRLRLQARRKKSRRSSRWTAVILLLFSLNVAIVGARNEVVRYLPQTASLFAAIGLPVNLRHLNFDKVRIAKETQDGVTVLVVQGDIVSASDRPVEVPRLRFAARNAGGQEIYTWTALPTRTILGPGETLKFNSRLAAPPKDAVDVMVRFFTAHDAMAAAK